MATRAMVPPRAGQARLRIAPGDIVVADNDPNRVWPSGLTMREAEELHDGLKQGTRIFGAIAVIAHILAFMNTPWLH